MSTRHHLHRAPAEPDSAFSPDYLTRCNQEHDQRMGPTPYCERWYSTLSHKEPAPPGFNQAGDDDERTRLIWDWHTLHREHLFQSNQIVL